MLQNIPNQQTLIFQQGKQLFNLERLEIFVLVTVQIIPISSIVLIDGVILQYLHWYNETISVLIVMLDRASGFDALRVRTVWYKQTLLIKTKMSEEIKYGIN